MRAVPGDAQHPGTGQSSMAAEDRRCCGDPFTVAPRLERRSRTSASRLELVERRDQARSRGKAVLGSPFGPRGRPLHALQPLRTLVHSAVHDLAVQPNARTNNACSNTRTALLVHGSAGMSSAGSRRGSSHALVPWNREQACSASGPSGGHAFSCSKKS